MSRKFKNPANGHTEEVGFEQSFLAFLFCGPYLLLRGLWGHFVIVMLFVVPLTIAAGPGGAILASLALGLLYALSIQSIISGKYLRAGWIEVIDTPSGAAVPSPCSAGTVAPTTRKCPYCAEEILRDAIRCKHCHAEVEPEPAPKPEALDEAAERLGVKRAGNLFVFQEYQYTRLEDAIDYAKRVNGEA